MTKPLVFISYSHKDKEWKDRLVSHLCVLQKQGNLDIWDDSRIGTGEDWFRDIQGAIQNATVAILLISADFLNSEFVLNEEILRFLELRMKKGLKIYPIILKPCAWKQVQWLAWMQVRPREGRAISCGKDPDVDTDMAEIAVEVATIANLEGTIDKYKEGTKYITKGFQKSVRGLQEQQEELFNVLRKNIENQSYDQAINLLNKLTYIAPEISNVADFHGILMLLYLTEGRYDLARSAGERAVSLDVNWSFFIETYLNEMISSVTNLVCEILNLPDYAVYIEELTKYKVNENEVNEIRDITLSFMREDNPRVFSRFNSSIFNASEINNAGDLILYICYYLIIPFFTRVMFQELLLEKARLIMPGRTIELTQNENRFGRGDFKDIIPDISLGYITKKEGEKYHFMITKQEGTFYIQDDFSKNGTKLNGKPIMGEGRIKLNNEDKITLAGIENIIIMFSVSGA